MRISWYLSWGLLFCWPIRCTRKVYMGHAVTSDLEESARVGSEIIEEDGGNALDAAIATAIDVGAINAFASGIGGGGFLLLWKKSKRNVNSGDEDAVNSGEDEKDVLVGFDFREMAPKQADERLYQDPKDSKRGRLSIGVPGEIMGLYRAHLLHGQASWESLFKRTIRKMREGFAVPKVLGMKLAEYQKDILADDGLAGTYSRDGRVVKERDIITRPNLANTLEIISKDPMAFYTGKLGDKIVGFLNKERKYFSREDFSKYKARTMTPIVTQLPSKNLKVVTLDLPTCGYMMSMGLVALFSLPNVNYQMLSERELQEILSCLYLQLYKYRTEFEDKDAAGPNGRRDRNNESARRVDEKRIQALINKLTSLVKNQPVLSEVELEKGVLIDHGTTHINVVDKDGMMVSLTSTINDYWGSGQMDPETGIIFNNQMDDFVFTKFANLSLMHAENDSKNRIAPWKRPLSSTMPTIIRHGQKFYVGGGSGGIRIPTAMISVMARILLRNESIGEAIRAPRLHLQSTDMVQIEANFAKENIPDDLQKAGVVKSDRPESITSCVHLIHYVQPKSDWPLENIETFSDPRKHSGSYGGAFVQESGPVTTSPIDRACSVFPSQYKVSECPIGAR
ncbi:gamma-glutamyltranspeptidase / glutathione hydrolase / leukotriene-C4 hydrolase [Nematocida homosporus]|uniref:gamma-glutamyltranspeptidase / glutathione hydrolase / leukotriene-C4 hydrolase n=1 Tax=Nematocida homosporus TaxID=1912981 RepID=UPI00221FBA20|nr:gamma-glutamyltranspeptidase / glutathione hydrolase / leukotriene-C4 hydrolase [Nematocida homosporus]KAI5185358.1 gamma-glutamyltranspeptidase / glutathione hydrolase / leukotriene-C4 hydrolase [Nematocida homosporus]